MYWQWNLQIIRHELKCIVNISGEMLVAFFELEILSSDIPTFGKSIRNIFCILKFYQTIVKAIEKRIQNKSVLGALFCIS